MEDPFLVEKHWVRHQARGMGSKAIPGMKVILLDFQSFYKTGEIKRGEKQFTPKI
jgi:hypothetical protein